MKISIVIPVYNEAQHLGACLRAIEKQLLQPLEVIVVDNNSTDNTRSIAESFSFVRLLSEPKQGVLHARQTGFNAARGEIIGRIDADTVLPPAWTQQVSGFFETSSAAAVSGSAHYHDFGWSRLADAIDRPLRQNLAKKLNTEKFLWGANMALQKKAWEEVQNSLCKKPNIHEDFDLAIHLQQMGYEVSYDQGLQASVSSRRVDTSYRAYLKYSLVAPQTYAAHGLKSRRHMYPVLLVCWAIYGPARLIYRSYNPDTGKFSAARLFVASRARIDPTTNIA